jgi:hypothetical protein
MTKITIRVANYILAHKAEWNAQMDNKATKQQQIAIIKAENEQKNSIMKASPEYKLGQIQERIKVWQTKQKRAETALKKLRRRENIYIKKLKPE